MLHYIKLKNILYLAFLMKKSVTMQRNYYRRKLASQQQFKPLQPEYQNVWWRHQVKETVDHKYRLSTHVLWIKLPRIS